MSWRNMNRGCSRCSHQDTYLAHKEETRDKWVCSSGSACSGTMEEVFACPAILTSESASFLDGTKRPGFQSLRDAALEGKKHGRG
jgi:hypothetical protein